MTSDDNHIFSRLFSDYIETVTKRGLDQGDELYASLIKLIERQEISPSDVVQALSDVFYNYPEEKLFLLQIMRAIVFTSKLFNGYAYPEFFWIVVHSNILFEISNINDIMTMLKDISNNETLRSLLTYMVITGNEASRRNAARAFYYVGFTRETLRLVTELSSVKDVDQYRYICAVAMGTLFGERAKTFSKDERDYFRSFFERGLESPDDHIVADSRRALEQLDVLAQQAT
jgi:hypothetical protein